MKFLLTFAVAASLSLAQTPAAPQAAGSAPNSLLSAKGANQLATRAVQLMESTAAAVPGLSAASEPLRRAAEQTLASMVRTPQNAVLTHQFVNQLRAFL